MTTSDGSVRRPTREARVGEYRRGSRIRDTPAGTWFPAVSPDDSSAGLLLVHPGVDLRVLLPTLKRLAELALPGVLPMVPELTTQSGRNWITATAPPGPALSDVIDEGPHRQPGNAALVLRDIADTLISVHQAGLAHGRLAITSVLLTPSGHPVLTDWATNPGASQSDDVAGWTQLARLLAERWCGESPEDAAALARAVGAAASGGLRAGSEQLAELAEHGNRASLVDAASIGPVPARRRGAARKKLATLAANPPTAEPPATQGPAAQDPAAPVPLAQDPAAPVPATDQDAAPPVPATPATPATTGDPIVTEGATETETPIRSAAASVSPAPSTSTGPPASTNGSGAAPREVPAGAATPATAPGPSTEPAAAPPDRQRPAEPPHSSWARPQPPVPAPPTEQPTQPTQQIAGVPPNAHRPSWLADPIDHSHLATVPVPPVEPNRKPGSRTPNPTEAKESSVLQMVLIGVLALVLAGASALLYLRINRTDDSGNLQIQSVTLQASPRSGVCMLTATITTNGRPGMLTYRWSGELSGEPVLSVSVPDGEHHVALGRSWSSSSATSPDPRVSIQILNPTPQSSETRPAAACP